MGHSSCAGIRGNSALWCFHQCSQKQKPGPTPEQILRICKSEVWCTLRGLIWKQEGMWFVVFQIIETLLGTKVPSLSDPFKFRYLKALSICIILSCQQSENRAVYGDSAAWKSLHELPVQILCVTLLLHHLLKTSIYYILHLTQLLNTALPPLLWTMAFNV